TLAFASGGSLSLVLLVVCVLSLGALVGVVRGGRVVVAGDVWPVVWGAVLGVVLGGVVWWASTVVAGDGLFHLARVRKLEEMPVLYSVNVVNEFRGGGLHPGYAFPLWHGVLALVARLA